MFKKITYVLLLTTGLVCFNNQSFAVEAPDFQQTKQLAEKGDAVAQFNLGLMYDNGDNVQKDSFKAL
ncbi:unnamed protein product [Commensalibacter communis]|uniref:hypothetical protein n=1 Tax=Commensalibacter communis TaxID=2972786 RepID=UPI0022FFB809|nr:hypothetical protein [Commensalibacter communis]CAI3951628.1 unnamed protein product [Commensalibacter communis]CAI3952798.1 unnamed protein product [Commensalibacter communis]